MNTALRYYLGEVLGLELVPAIDSSPKVQSESVVVLCGYLLNEAEDLLLRRMMQAIGVTDFTIEDTPSAGPGVGLVLGSAGQDQLSLAELGASQELNGRRWLRTYSLQDMLKGSEGEIQSRKRIAWGHLQTLRVWLKESQH